MIICYIIYIYPSAYSKNQFRDFGTLGLWDFGDFFETKKARDPLGQRAFFCKRLTF